MSGDDITIPNGAVVAADTVGGAHYQRMKPATGIDGTAEDVSPVNPMPVALAQDGKVNLILSRFLDTVGDGSGVKNANLDFNSTPDIFFIQPPSGVIYKIHRLIVSVEDTNGYIAAEYGNIGSVLSTGITVRVQDGSGTIVDLTDGEKIKSNADFGKFFFDVDLKTYGAGDEMLVARWTFTNHGVPLRLDGTTNERLEVTLDDDLTGLLGHFFMVHGYEEDSLT